jgi:hypothetical protein
MAYKIHTGEELTDAGASRRARVIMRGQLIVMIRRFQLEGQVPQSAFDQFAPDGVFRMIGFHELQEPQRHEKISVWECTTANGAVIKFDHRLRLPERLTRAPGRGLPVDRRTTLMEVELRYFDGKYPGAYALRFSPEPGLGRPAAVVDIVASRNIRVDLRIKADVLALPSMGDWRTAMQERIAGSPFARHFALRLCEQQVPTARVPRPAHRWRADMRLRSISTGLTALRWLRREHLEILPDEERERQVDDALLVAGLIPGISDVLDLGQFVLGLATGRDIVGRRLTPLDYLALGLAVLPGIPGVARQLPRLPAQLLAAGNDMAQRLARGGLRIDWDSVLEAARPRLAMALRETVVQAHIAAMFGAGSAALSFAAEFAAEFSAETATRQAADCGILRDSAVLEQVVANGHPPSD